MANIQVVVTTDSNVAIKQMADGQPAWFGNEGDKTKWWSGTDDINYFWSLGGSETARDTYIQYGQNVSKWASSKHWRQSIAITSQTQNDDGSIHVVGEITVPVWASNKTDFAGAGVRVTYDISVAGTQVYTFSGNTIDEFKKTSAVKIPIDVTVKAGDTYTGTAMKIVVNYPDGEYDGTTSTIGLSLKNPNPPTYVAGAYKEPTNGEWRSNNKHAKRNWRKTTGSTPTWNLSPKETISTAGNLNTGHERVKKADNSGWYQARNEDPFHD